MTIIEARKIEQALDKMASKCQLTKETKDGKIWKLTFPLTNSAGEKFRFYFFQEGKSKRLYFSDGGAILKAIESCGKPQTIALQQLVSTFGLSVMEDATIMDLTTRPLAVRVMSYLQAWCAIDGVVRIWKVKSEEVKDNALRSTSRQREADEALRTGSAGISWGS